MKKTLIALAALAATGAFAQSTVTISGLVDIGYQSINGPGNENGIQTGDINTVKHNGTATTAIILSGSEDIGGGLKAEFRYEMNPDFIAGSGLTGAAGVTSGTGAVGYGNGATGYSYVGLTGGFGSVKLGRLNTGTLTAWGNGSVFGTALGSGYGSSAIFTRYGSSSATYNNTAPTRFNGAIEYSTPTMNGLSARLLYVPSVDYGDATVNGAVDACTTTACSADTTTAAGANRMGVTDFSIHYSSGPVNVSVAQQSYRAGSGVNTLVSPTLKNADGTLTTLGANYTMGNLKVLGAYWTETNNSTGTSAVDVAAYMLGASYTMGKVTLMASMGRSDDRSSNDIDRTIVGLGADYALSKRTAVYARYEDRDANTNSGADTAAAGNTTTVALGIRHTF